MSPASCPPKDELSSLLWGQLPPGRAEQVEQHVESCETCQVAVQTLGSAGDWLVEGLRNVAADSGTLEPACEEALSRIRRFAAEPSALNLPSAAAAPGPEDLGMIREYRLLAKLGQGGMGAVYKAQHTKLRRIVAIKVLPADRVNTPQAVARFEREMQAVGSLDHENIVRAFDAGEDHGQHYLAMEYVKGYDVGQVARTFGKLPIAEACEIIRQAAVGLDHAHAAGLVHRDIKPANLMLTESGVVKVLDLGLALLNQSSEPGGELTGTGQVMGTLDYMAPEQGGDTHNVDARADVYSLGASLYRLLCGVAPFGDPQFNSVVRKLSALALNEPTRLEQRRPEVPEELAAIVHRMLAKSPDDRFSTPAEVARALAPFAAGANLASLMARAESMPATSRDPATHPTASSLGSAADKTAPPRVDVPQGVTRRFDAAISPPAATAPARRKPVVRAALMTLGGVAGLALVLWGVTVIFWETPKGTVRIEFNDDQIQAQFDSKGKVFKGVDQDHEIRLSEGPHGLTITRGDLRFRTDKFILKKDDTVLLKIELLPGKLQIVQGEKVLDQFALELVDAAAPVAAGHWLRLLDPFDTAKADVDFSVEGPRTIELWVRPSAAPAENSTAGYLANLQRVHQIRLETIVANGEPSPRWKYKLELDSGDTEIYSKQPAELNRWTHIAAVYDTRQTRLYINGVLSGAAKSDGRLKGSTNESFVIGAVGKTRQTFEGEVRGARISSIARYAEDFTPGPRFERDKDTLALYHYNDGQGETLRDSSGHARHGKISGAQWVKADEKSLAESSPIPTDKGSPKERGALSFEPANAHVAFPTLTYDDKRAVTIEAWIRRDAAAPRISLKGARSLVLFHNEGTWRFNLVENTASSGIVASWTTPEKTWSHIAAVADGEKLRLFFDGKPAQSEPTRGHFPNAAVLPSYIGKIPKMGATGTRRAGGVMAGLLISQSARYEREFTPPARFEVDKDTLALYRFDDGQGEVLQDASGNKHHGKIVSATWVKVEGTDEASPGSENRVVDLLALVDVERDAVNGKWTKDASGLASEGGVPYCRLALPYRPPAEYDFRVEFTAAGSNDILQILSAKDRSFTWLMGGWGGQWDGFDSVTNRPFRRDGVNIVGGPSSIKRGQRHTSVVQVRKNSVSGLIDGELVIRYGTDLSDLSIPEPWKIEAGRLGLGTTFDATVFHKIEVIEVSGPGELLPKEEK